MSLPIPRMAVVACSVPEGEIGLHSAGSAHIAQAEGEYARRWVDWRFERMCGDQSLLVRDFLWGNRDGQRFQMMEPGSRLGSSADAAITRAECADKKADAS